MSRNLNQDQDQEWTAGWQEPYRSGGQSRQAVFQHGQILPRPLNQSLEEQDDSSNTPRFLPGHYGEATPTAEQSQAASAYRHDPLMDQRPSFDPSAPTGPGIYGHASNLVPAVPNFTPSVHEAIQHNPGSPSDLSVQFGQIGISSPPQQSSQHVRVTRTRQTSQGYIPFSYTTPAIIHSNLQHVSGHEEKLYASFKRSSRPRKFFKFGKVFLTLWAEPAGESTSSVGSTYTALSGISRGSFGERVFSKIRRFIVVREGNESCIALPINTYDGEGVKGKGSRKCEHAIIFTGKDAPLSEPAEAPSRGERGLLPQPIRVDGDDPAQKLDVMSRVDFGKVYTIEHNVKVRSMGKVNRESEGALLYQFKTVWASPMGITSGRDFDEKSSFTGTIESQSANSVLDYIEAYNALIAVGFTDVRARSVLKNNLPSVPEQPNKAPAEDNLKKASRPKKSGHRVARADITSEQPESKGFEESTDLRSDG